MLTARLVSYGCEALPYHCARGVSFAVLAAIHASAIATATTHATAVTVIPATTVGPTTTAAIAATTTTLAATPVVCKPR